MGNTPLVAPRVPLVDPKTGMVAREWYLFFLNQKNLTGGSGLSKSNDTNVTLTLEGSPGNALLAPVALRLGWAGTLSVARGGTGASTATAARDNLGAAAADHTHSEYEPLLGYTPVNKAGDTMTGPLTLPGDPTDNLQAATKGYVDAMAVAGTFTAAKIVTIPSGGTFELVFTDAGDVVAVD